MTDYKEEKRKFRVTQLTQSIKLLEKITWNLRIMMVVDAISWYFLKWKLRLMIRNMNVYNDLYETVWETKYREAANNSKNQIEIFANSVGKIYNTEITIGEK